MQENLLQNNITSQDEHESDLAEEDDVGTEDEIDNEIVDNDPIEEEKDEY